MVSVEHPVAFFSMEYALSDAMPFAGGLGVLAADYLLECGKQGFPLVALGLAYDGVEQLGLEKKPEYYYKEYGSAKLYLLNSGILGRSPYGPEFLTQLRQELFLAFEGVKLLKDLGTQPALYHLNEGHTGLTILALKKAGDTTPVVATKHTVLTQSGLHIPLEDFRAVLHEVWPEANFEEIYAEGSDENHPEFFSTNKFMIKYAVRSNGVSVKHCEVEKEVHKNSPLIPLTNGINPDRWQAQNLKSDSGTDPTLWQKHEENRSALVDFINQKTGSKLDPKVLTVVWARRLAEYKQPELLLSNYDKLKQLIKNPGRPIQFVVGGQPYPKDPGQYSIAERLEAVAKNPDFSGRFAFLPHYGLDVAKILVAGADVWLNTPLVGKEACGTSTMKAGLNGALLLTTADGWIAEEDWSHGGGWILGEIYELLADKIAPLFYDRPNNLPKSWLAHMRLIMNLIATKYLTSRMLEDYKTKLYNL
ncbi:alpha-glucan family phosphorylase [Patescibacteria group bacterium]|nr:alpha-glucan family phosphorylase [Patescibacteria group bacterium]